MENLLNYNFKEIRFISIFNKILISFLGISLILLIVLPINDSVKSSRGEIISENPQKDYISPYESILDTLLIKEGDFVKKGDTLLILSNNLLDKDYYSKNREYDNLIQNKKASENSINNISQRIKYLKQEINILFDKYKIDKTKNSKEFRSLQNEVYYLQEKLNVSTSKLKMDSTLYKKGVVSRLDITNSYDNYLTYLNNSNSTKNRFEQIQINKSTIKNTFLKNKNYLNIQLINLEEELTKEQEKLSITINRLADSKNTIEYYNTELNKQYFITGIDGIITNIFNFKKSSNILKKNDLLISISPAKNKFYAKVIIPQRDLWQIEVGQIVNLKIDAYYYYKHGITKGKISYISERINDDTEFYVLVNFDNDATLQQFRTGYSIKSEIVIERMRLWQFIFKKLFRKVGDLS
jgi:multidrug efflux pump subunit AcrA (membrane-fusion protein)